MTEKLLKDVVNEGFKSTVQHSLVNYIVVLGGWKKLDKPMLSDEIECLVCGCREHHVCIIDPSKPLSEKLWICGNRNCVTCNAKNIQPSTITQLKFERAIEWPLFCEINGIGDMNHDIKFELIEQSDPKISYMLKFTNTPNGILIMQGKTGSGKTYAAMGICELFTKSSKSCVFMTHKQMTAKWLESPDIFLSQMTNVQLLVIDDFGLSEPTKSFMNFFMELINTRLQRKDKGTIITTNLEEEMFNKFCGDALVDRIATGQWISFQQKSRRKKTIL